MRVAITGSHSTGKTTILNELKILKPEYKYYGEITRSLNKNIKINEYGNDETQELIMQKHLDFIEFTNNDDINIMDRCILDGFVYSYYLFKNNRVSIDNINFFRELLLENIDRYDLIFFIEPEFDIVDDNVRSTNKEFRSEINRLFNEFINQFNIKVIRIKGSVQERVETIIKGVEDESKFN